MKINTFIMVVFYKIFIFMFVINFILSCSSSETPSQSNQAPSIVSGTYFESPLEFAAGENPLDLAFADFNSDNVTDILVTSPRKQEGTNIVDDGTLILFQRDSTDLGSFPYTSIIIEPDVSEWRQDLLATDFNGDNISDIIFTHADQGIIKFLKNDGSGNFSDNGSLSVGNFPMNIVSGDWNSDNQSDIAVVNRDNNSISILNNANGSFSVLQTLNVEEVPIKIVSGDWNNDNHDDLAVLSRNSKLVQILINNGSGVFDFLDTTYEVGSLPYDMVSGDWNCDSKIDLAVTNSGDDTLSLIFGKGTGYFESEIIINSGRGPRGIVYADFNGDNKLDFIVGHQFSLKTSGFPLLTGDFSLTLSDSNSSNGYTTPISFAVSLAESGEFPAELAILYVDNDSKLDIVATLPGRKKLVLISGKQFDGNLSCP